jgi:2-polyprenyl-6-methoxyphenol hydroxylase-like FAD-dependent oxidoreductase
MLLADGRTYWYATWSAARPVPDEPGARLAALRSRYADWHPTVGALLAATDPQAVHVAETVRLVAPLPTLAVGRAALLGDAVHAMTPDLGQGGCQAFEDAVALGALLDGAKPADVPAALARYDALRRPRTTALQQQARRMNRLLRLRGPAGGCATRCCGGAAGAGHVGAGPAVRVRRAAVLNAGRGRSDGAGPRSRASAPPHRPSAPPATPAPRP